MSKLDWSKSRRTASTRERPILSQEHARRLYFEAKNADPDGYWIVVGADCPWNKTPGQRRVYHFNTPSEAKRAGFTGIR